MKNIKRRDFLRSGLMAGGAVLLGPRFLSAVGQPFPGIGKPDIVSISGDDPAGSLAKLLEPLGGIGQFVHEGQTVGILANSPWKNPGYYTRPDIVLALAKLCLEAGAKEIVCFKQVPAGYWEKCPDFDKYKDIIQHIKYGSDRVEMDIPGGKSLKKAEMFRIFNEVDVFISVPVAKHHNGVIFSGNLKGLMGVSSSATNRKMHSPDGSYTYDNHEYLAQCIADLNLLRKPDLCIVDAVECAINNGPAGPGDTVKPNKIIAGTDPLALDVYSASLIGFSPADILTFSRAYEHGLGEIDPGKLTLLEV